MSSPTSTKSATNFRLTAQDVQDLLNEPAPETRALLAQKIAQGHKSGAFQQNELKVAEQIFRMLLKDAQIQVRLALSQGLQDDPNAPKDIILALANDHAEEVASPVVQYSPVIEDNDLLDLISDHGDLTRLIAIANRNHVSKMVSTALVETSKEEVVGHLVNNQGADISEHSLNRVLRDFGSNHSLMENMARRAELPVTIVEKLISVASDNVAAELKHKYTRVAQKLEEEAKRAREQITLKMLDTTTEPEAVNLLVDELYSNKRLTPSIVLTALCRGNFAFFETGIARMAGIPAANAHKLIHDKGGLGFKALYKKADLPDSMFDACEVVLQVMHELHDQGLRPTGNVHFANRAVEKIFQHTAGKEIENLAYIIALIRQNFR